MDNRPLVLASTSRYRRHLFEQLHVPFEAVDPGVDEEPFKQRGLPPAELVRVLALEKALAVARTRADALVIAGDQVAAIDEQVLGKPGSFEASVAQLEQLAGRTHRLVTAICVADARSGRNETFVDTHEMSMRALDSAQLRRYVEVDMPLDCAGAYRLESLGVALFDHVSGSDPTAIVGIPLMRLAQLLSGFGYDVFLHARHA